MDVNVLVVGDVMLDRYWRADANRISPEAPVPVASITCGLWHLIPPAEGTVCVNENSNSLTGSIGGFKSFNQMPKVAPIFRTVKADVICSSRCYIF